MGKGFQFGDVNLSRIAGCGAGNWIVKYVFVIGADLTG
jgi:hypothetical protein